MRRVLHIFTRMDDPLAREILLRQQSLSGLKVESVDLTVPEPDYKNLLEKIFQAESAECW